jgi:Icc-related predicted phosphoesterase
MRLVATADTHFPVDPELIPDGDVFVLAGDFMYSGYIGEWYPRLDAIAALPHEHKIVVCGNHDIHVQNYAGPALAEMRKAGIRVLGFPSKMSPKMDLPNGMTMGGSPFVHNLPGWAFNNDETAVWAYLDDMGRVDILVSHSPPRGLLDRGTGHGGHFGMAALRKYINRFQPDMFICGHVHEGYGTVKEGRTLVANVAHCDLDYKTVNPPMVWDL